MIPWLLQHAHRIRDDYRQLRGLGLRTLPAFVAALPTRWHLLHALMRGHTVVFRARIEDGTVVINRPSFVIETHIIGAIVRPDERVAA